MHEPWRHRARLDPNAGVISRMSAHRSGDLFRLCGALTPPQSMASIVDDANGRRLLLNFQTDKVGHVEAPMVRITGNVTRIAALSNDQAPTAITRCPHMNRPNCLPLIKCNVANLSHIKKIYHNMIFRRALSPMCPYSGHGRSISRSP